MRHSHLILTELCANLEVDLANPDAKESQQVQKEKEESEK
jgi:hypothetical protein